MTSSTSGTKSTFLVLDVSPCRCYSCTVKIRLQIEMGVQEPVEPRMVPTLSKTFSWTTVCLPCEHLSKDYYRHEPVSIDEDVESYLTEKKVINWCQAVNKLYPVRTTGDGNCLMHAVGLFMWGLQDELMSLRKLVYSALIQSGTNSFRQRWQRERERLNENIPGGLHFNDEEWLSEWNIVVNAAQLTEQTSKDNKPKQSLEFLEEIHIFVLANVLRRPIIVLAEPTVLSPMLGDSIEHNNFVGIYLPLLWPPKECARSPIILCFMLSHFLPLVVQNNCCKGALAYGVPLVTQAMEPLYIHFLMPEEDKTAHQLLQEYLYTSEVRLITKTIAGNSLGDIILISEFDPAMDIEPKTSVANCPIRNKTSWIDNKGTKSLGSREISENTPSKAAINYNSPDVLQDIRTDQSNTSLQLDVVAGTGKGNILAKSPGVQMNETELKCAFYFLHVKCLMVNCDEDVSLHSYPFHFCKDHEVRVRKRRDECVMKNYATKVPLYYRNSALVAKHCYFFGCQKPMYKESYPFCRDHAEIKFLLNEYNYDKLWRLSTLTDSWSPKFLQDSPKECLRLLQMLTIFENYLYLMTFLQREMTARQDCRTLIFSFNYTHKLMCELLQVKLSEYTAAKSHAKEIEKEKWQFLDDVTDDEILHAKQIFDILYLKPRKAAKCDVEGCSKTSDPGGFCSRCVVKYIRYLTFTVKNEEGGILNKKYVKEIYDELGSRGDGASGAGQKQIDNIYDDGSLSNYYSNKKLPSKEMSRYGESRANVKSIKSGNDRDDGDIDEVDGISSNNLYSNFPKQQSDVPIQDVNTSSNSSTKKTLKTGQMCLTSTCDLYSDPAYHGYCSHCYNHLT